MTEKNPAEDLFTPPDAGRARAEREFSALTRIATRHANAAGARQRQAHPTALEPHEAVRLVMALAGGSVTVRPGEPAIDEADLTAALTLVPHVRADLDALEAGLLRQARDRGLTWQAIAFGLGLGSAQAARQRLERLSDRLPPEP
ncbi:hypothetical protein GCM10023322_81610 [Rugosimonospora acidiphila]|uniref:DNA-binding protein n=1 Tax=Rugosimonospora acidiphila TaxID=556531 RepID=A0ABP9SUU4_9ACTN